MSTAPRADRNIEVPTKRVLVLGEDSRAFLSVVRSLGRAGLEVHIGGCPVNAPAAYSRYVARAHRMPPYVPGDPAPWLKYFVDLVQEHSFDLVIPCDDPTILPLQAHRQQIEPVGRRVYLLDPKAFDTCLDKGRTSELAGRLGIPVPRHLVIDSPAELRHAAQELGFPLVLKPRSSFDLGALHARRAVLVVRDQASLERADAWLEEVGPVLGQEYFGGRGVGIDALCRNGQLLVALQHQRLHEPLLGGGSSYRRTVGLDPELHGAAARLLEAMEYTGVAMVEFRVNRTTGSWTLMEINGRFWGSLPLSLAAGADFPRYLYEMLVLGRSAFPGSYKEGVFARNWLADYHWLRRNLTADASDPLLLTVPTREIIKELGNVLRLRESSDTLALDDPAPAASELVTALRPALMRRLRRTWPLRQLYARRLRRALRKASSILFLCKGNICRSPFAAAHLSQQLRGRVGKQARSAGCKPTPGRPAPAEAIVAASKLGVDLTGHRSSSLDDESARASDLVLVFDESQELFLRANAPELVGRMHFLGALDPDGPLEVADPFGGDEARFVASYRRIGALVGRAASLMGH